MANELIVSVADEQAALEAQRFMPVMSMNLAVERRQVIIDAVQKLMKDGQDYGTIPGTQKPTLLQPGADKLCNLFGLVARFETLEEAQDWTGEKHGGEPFFYYKVRCRLMRGDFVMGEGDGSCNSWESRYRWRKTERTCPQCGQSAIIRGKKEYGGGWLCFAKKGGCGAKFAAGDAIIEEQVVGQRPNPDIFDIVNTLLKIANKRGKIAATLNATSAHEFFTQDIEEIPAFGQPSEPEPALRPQHPESKHEKDPVPGEYQEQAVRPNTGRVMTPKQPIKPEPQRHTTTTKKPDSAQRGGAAESKSEYSSMPSGGGTPPHSIDPPDVPEDVQEMWNLMVDLKSSFTVFAELKKSIMEITGSDVEYRNILRQHGWESAQDIKGKGRNKVRQVARELYEAMQRFKKSVLEPSFVAIDDDMPEILQQGQQGTLLEQEPPYGPE